MSLQSKKNKGELIRRLVLQVTAPAIFAGICLAVMSIFSLWQLDRARRNLSYLLSQNVASVRAASRMEDAVRRMRFASLEYLLDGKEKSRAEIERAKGEFETWLHNASLTSNSTDEKAILDQITEGFRTFQVELDRVNQSYKRQFPPKSFREVVDGHPINIVVEPCRQLAQANEDYMQRTVDQEAVWSKRVHWIFLGTGLLAPLAAATVGYNLARRMGKRLLRLQIQIGDAARQLKEGFADIEVSSTASIDELDSQMQYLTRRVQDIVMELGRHQRDAIRNQQLAAVGQLAASLAHEIRNPLTAIKMLVEAALRDERPRPMSAESLRVVHREVERLEQTVQELLDFARPPTLKRTIVPLSKMINGAVELVQARATRQRVDIRRIKLSDVTVDVDEGQLRGVFVNLLLNSLDAMPQGGTIDINNLRNGNSIYVTIADSGSGIPSSAFETLFTPFSSSKVTGTGLGLSICKRVVEQHQGAISAHNRKGGGAELEIRLPLANE